MRIYISHSLGLREKVAKYVKELEDQGHEVYFPSRDTNQGLTAAKILEANFKGVEGRDEVHVIWDGASYGTIFDLGMAYALRIPIKVVYIAGRTWYSHLKENLGKRIVLE